MTNEEYAEIMDKSNFMIDSANPYDMEIKEALEKQIPIKPIIKTNAYNHKFYKCPNCGIDIENVMYSPYVYCHKCGQKLNWGNEDDRED